MNKVFGVILALAILWFGLQPAIKFGGILESQANPTENVTVTLGDKNITGSLSIEWSGDYSLKTTEGTYLFNRAQASRISYNLPPKLWTDKTLAIHWRLFLPPLLVATLGLTILFFSLLPISEVKLRLAQRSN